MNVTFFPFKLLMIYKLFHKFIVIETIYHIYFYMIYFYMIYFNMKLNCAHRDLLIDNQTVA